MSQLTYRPAIDGMRSLAIISVFIFHLNESWLPGGFSGVDVFFVISGYLITSIIYRDCLNGTFSFARFYQRRISRIFPAFFLVAVVTLAAAYFIYDALEVAAAGGGFVAAMLSVANMKMLRQGNYFELSMDTQPYLHYWSLSLEEQFYMVFPFVLFFLFRHFRKGILPFVTLLVVLGYVACIIVTKWNSTWAFYLLPTRGWEMGAGALLAIVANEKNAPAWLETWRKHFPWVGLLLILVSFVILGKVSVFPGYIAILPVLGTVLLLAMPQTSGNWVERLLSLSLLVWIGRISYSLYLWHWPVFSYVDYHFLLASDSFRILLKCALSISAAVLSYWLVETPARRYLNLPTSQRRSYIIFFSILVVGVAAGCFIWKSSYIHASAKQVEKGGVVYGEGRNGGSVLLLGDSYASMYGVTVKEICQELDKKLIVAAVDGHDVLPPKLGQRSSLWDPALDIVVRDKPDTVILVSAWLSKLQGDTERLEVALNAFEPHTEKIVIINLHPYRPSEGTRSSIRAGARPPFNEMPEAADERIAINALLAKLESDKVTVIDATEFYFDANGSVIVYTEAMKPAYSDRTHLSEFGANILKPKLKEVLKAAK